MTSDKLTLNMEQSRKLFFLQVSSNHADAPRIISLSFSHFVLFRNKVKLPPAPVRHRNDSLRAENRAVSICFRQCLHQIIKLLVRIFMGGLPAPACKHFIGMMMAVMIVAAAALMVMIMTMLMAAALAMLVMMFMPTALSMLVVMLMVVTLMTATLPMLMVVMLMSAALSMLVMVMLMSANLAVVIMVMMLQQVIQLLAVL